MKYWVATFLNVFLFATNAQAADVLSYRVHLNADRAPGKVDVVLNFHVDGDENVNFDALLAAVKDVEMGNKIGERLMKEKPLPMKWIKSVMSLNQINPPEPGTGYTYSYRVDGCVDKMLMCGLTKKTTIIKCKDSLTGAKGSRRWVFGCAIELDPNKGAKDGPEFFSSYSQPMFDAKRNPENYCVENGTAVDCRLHVTTTLKKVDVPGIAEVLFGVKDYSPSQAGHKFIESLLHGYFVLFELVKLPKPFENQVKTAVKNFKASSRAQELENWIQSYPRASAELTEAR